MGVANTLPEVALVSEMKSLRRLIYDVFGGPDTDPKGDEILIHRDARAVRPFWRIDSSLQTTIQPAASGWDDGDRPQIVVYAGVDYETTYTKISKLRDVLQRHACYPFRFYQGAWFAPKVRARTQAGGTLAPGTYTVSCTITNPDNEETLPSDPVSVTIGAGQIIETFVPVWPWQGPLAKDVSVYAASGTGARRLAATTAQILPAVGWMRVLIEHLPAGSAALEPTTSSVYAGTIRVPSVQTRIVEPLEAEREWDGICIIHTQRPLWTHENLEGTEGFKPYSEITVATDLLDLP